MNELSDLGKTVLQYGALGLCFLMMIGGGLFLRFIGNRIALAFDKMASAMDKMVEKLGTNEVAAVARHGEMQKHVTAECQVTRHDIANTVQPLFMQRTK